MYRSSLQTYRSSSPATFSLSDLQSESVNAALLNTSLQLHKANEPRLRYGSESHRSRPDSHIHANVIHMWGHGSLALSSGRRTHRDAAGARAATVGRPIKSGHPSRILECLISVCKRAPFRRSEREMGRALAAR